MFLDDFSEGFELRFGVNGAGGVAGGVEEDELCAGRDGFFELVGRDLEVLADAGVELDGGAFGEEDHLGVADPIGGGDEDFVAGVD